MPEFTYRDLIELGEDTTPYRKLTSDHVASTTFNGNTMLQVAPEALTTLASQAFNDISHLLRPGHLKQLRAILDDPEASANDRFVAYELLKNANISAGGVLPMCQDTGTAIVMGKKGQQVWTGADDAEALARGVYKSLQRDATCATARWRRSTMFEEVNTGDNLPAQIELYATDGDEYDFLFVAKGGGSANKTFLFQETPARLSPRRCSSSSTRRSSRSAPRPARPITSRSSSAAPRRSSR